MKKITLLVAVLLLAFSAHAQFHVTSNFGEITDGETFTFYSVQKEDASVEYEVHNDGTEPIFMRLKVLQIQNADGNNVEICFGYCYYSIQEGMTAPLSNPYPVIQPGEIQTSVGDHFWNGNSTPTDPTQPIIYELQFQQISGDGSQVFQTLTWTYEYIPEMGVESQTKSFQVRILRTMISNGELAIKAQNPVSVQIYNLLGKAVKTADLNSGTTKLNVSNLAPQIYLVRFHNAQGQVKTQKIVIE